MNGPQIESETAIDFQDLCFEELGRSPVAASEEAVAETPELAQSDRHHRCDSARRELLGNHFPEE